MEASWAGVAFAADAGDDADAAGATGADAVFWTGALLQPASRAAIRSTGVRSRIMAVGNGTVQVMS